MMDENIAYEVYTITLKHELVSGDHIYPYGEPLVVKSINVAFPSVKGMISDAYLLNDMMDKLKHALIEMELRNERFD